MPGVQDKGTGGVERGCSEGSKEEVKETAGVEKRRSAKDAGTATLPGTLLCSQGWGAPAPHFN